MSLIGYFLAMRPESEPRVLLGFKVKSLAKGDFEEYLLKSAYPYDKGLAFGDLARFGREIVAAGLTLREAGGMLRVLARDPKVKRRVRKALERETNKLLDEKLKALYMLKP